MATDTIAVMAGSTAAYAVTAGPIDSSGVIHGCYYAATTGGSHKVVLQNVGTNCPSGTTAIKWNQQGPAGPQGPQGIQGPPGPPGAVAGYVDTADTDISLNTGYTTVATLNLPAGSFLMTAKAVVFGSLTRNDDVGCYLFDGGGNQVDASYTQLDSVNSSGAYNQETVALTGATTVGGLMQVRCVDNATEAIANHTSITAVPVASMISASPSHQSHVRSGAPATRAGR